MKLCSSVIVSWDISEGINNAILLVGEQKNEEVNIVNAFQGREAVALLNQLWRKRDTGNK